MFHGKMKIFLALLVIEASVALPAKEVDKEQKNSSDGAIQVKQVRTKVSIYRATTQLLPSNYPGTYVSKPLTFFYKSSEPGLFITMNGRIQPFYFKRERCNEERLCYGIRCGRLCTILRYFMKSKTVLHHQI